MERLFEAKARVNDQYTFYDVFRLTQDTYRAILKLDNESENENQAPQELILEKKEGKWHTEDSRFTELGATLGVEIDVFNMGYGDLLGRIGIS
jgi:hypothetical protein